MWSSPDYSNTATYTTLRTAEFNTFIATYDRNYETGSAEYQYRLEWFSENYEWITGFSGSFSVDVNHFADWTDEEYEKILNDAATTETRTAVTASLASGGSTNYLRP